MNELVEKLLAPISPEQPCGPDLSYDPRLEELETILKGKPEVEMGSVKKPAEPPDWRDLKDKSALFLDECKHLRAAMMLCCAWLKTGGLTGFNDGLQMVRGLVEQYWPALYPLLDPEDNNDPTQRLNMLGGLTAPRGSVDGWLTIVDYLFVAPVCQPKGAPPITYEQIQAAKQKESSPESAPANAPDPAKLAAAIRGVAQQAAAQHKILQESLESVRALDQFLTTTLGSSSTISFDVLDKTLQEMVDAVGSYVAEGEADAGASSGEAGTGASDAAPESGAIHVSGSVRTREDVVRAIDSICEYYVQVEPSSPVPYLLRRAQKLAMMNFVQAVQELSLANIDSLRPSMGSGLEAEGEAPPTEETPQG